MLESTLAALIIAWCIISVLVYFVVQAARGTVPLSKFSFKARSAEKLQCISLSDSDLKISRVSVVVGWLVSSAICLLLIYFMIAFWQIVYPSSDPEPFKVWAIWAACVVFLGVVVAGLSNLTKFSFRAKSVGEQKCISLSQHQLRISRVAVVTGWILFGFAGILMIATVIVAISVVPKYLPKEISGKVVDFLGWTDIGNFLGGRP